MAASGRVLGWRMRDDPAWCKPGDPGPAVDRIDRDSRQAARPLQRRLGGRHTVRSGKDGNGSGRHDPPIKVRCAPFMQA